MHKVQIQYAIQHAICNTKYNMHKVYIYTLQRFLSAQLVSIYEERIHLWRHVSCCYSYLVCWQTKINHETRKLIVGYFVIFHFVFFTLSDKKLLKTHWNHQYFLYLSFINYELLTNRTTSTNWQNISESRTGIVLRWLKQILSQKLIFSHFCNLTSIHSNHY